MRFAFRCLALLGVVTVTEQLGAISQAAGVKPPRGWFIIPPSTPIVGGPNRVVTSPLGYSSARGTFARTGKMWLNLEDSQGKLTNPRQDKPTFYLGITSDSNYKIIEVDAGAQFEPLPKDGYGPGWSAVMLLSVRGFGRWDQPTIAANRRFDVGDVPTEFTVTRKGIVTLKMGKFPTIINDVSVVSQGPLNLGLIRMKRVVGLTQSRGYTRDGSYVFQTGFSEGRVRRPALGASYTAGWPTEGSGLIIKPPLAAGLNPRGLRIINMEPPWQRAEPGGTEQDPNAHLPNRYTSEVVNIDLRSAAHIEGIGLRTAK